MENSCLRERARDGGDMEKGSAQAVNCKVSWIHFPLSRYEKQHFLMHLVSLAWNIEFCTGTSQHLIWPLQGRVWRVRYSTGICTVISVTHAKCLPALAAQLYMLVISMRGLPQSTCMDAAGWNWSECACSSWQLIIARSLNSLDWN